MNRSVPRDTPRRLELLNVTRDWNAQEPPTLARRLEDVLPRPLRLTVTRTVPLQPRLLPTPLGSLSRPRVVKRYGGRRSRLGRTSTARPGRRRTAFGLGETVGVGTLSTVTVGVGIGVGVEVATGLGP